MISLFEYILESLGVSDIKNKMKFEQISYDDFLNILDTDEYNHGQDLGLENIKKDKDEVFGLDENISKCYKITYENNILGIFSYMIYSDFKKFKKDIDKNLFSYLSRAMDSDSDIDLDKDKTAYIISLQISKYQKEKLDIHSIAVIKAFYEKIINEFKKNGIEMICAHGKDDKVTNGYCKAGGFKKLNIDTKVVKYLKSRGVPEEAISMFVYKKI